jgi:quercetin dioxygenase-like cupin family protein
MKAKLAAALIMVAGCGGGGSKTPQGPTSPAGDMGATDGAATDGAATDPGMAKVKEAPPPPPPPDTGGFHLLQQADLKWMPLSPDGKGPEMAVLHGNPQEGASAFFLRIPPGAKAGVHTHSADYQAVVLAGGHKHWLAGGAKKAKALAVGSHWFQPGGQAHDDECSGTEQCMLFIVSEGKFDFTPDLKAKAPKPGKYKLTARKDAKWAPFDPSQPDGMKLAVVHGDPKVGPVGFLIEIPAGKSSGLHSHTGDYHAVILEGAPAHWLPHESADGPSVGPGTYWFQPGGYDHGDRCTGDKPCYGFVWQTKALDFKPAAAAALK